MSGHGENIAFKSLDYSKQATSGKPTLNGVQIMVNRFTEGQPTKTSRRKWSKLRKWVE